MRLQSPWHPRFADIEGSPADRLVAALADDIVEGRLASGERLPAHRDLAYRLGMGLGSVTKAFAILERRGLIETVKGRGSFVATVEARRGSVINLAVNTPPMVVSEQMLAKSFAAITRKMDPAAFSLYPPLWGHSEHRRLMARWLAGLGLEADVNRLMLCGGAQQALAIALSVACKSGSLLLTEAVSYPGAIELARYQGYALTPLEMDIEGILPASLEKALQSEKKGNRPVVLYLTPTLQNPTTATMSLDRREQIVRLARRYDILIVEDDVYSIAAAATIPPLASLAPERTFYVNSLSKTLSPGLRIGVLIVPPNFVDQAETAQRTHSSRVSPLSCAIMAEWLSDGTIPLMLEAIEIEARRRIALARSIFGDELRAPAFSGFHVWLPMPRDTAERLYTSALACDVLITPIGAMAVDPKSTDCGIRLCLGGPAWSDLTSGLTTISNLLV